jgi:hypothetical protein
MKKIKKDTLFKRGIWIKEQQGSLTIGSLDNNEESVMIIPDKLSSKIFEFENDMIEALYGEKKVPFNPAVIDIEKLLANIGKKFKENDLRISFSGTKDNVFKGDYNEIFNLIEKFVLSSLSDTSKKEKVPLIHINASVLQDHLCIIYRDSGSISDPSLLRDEIDFIKTVLKGEISYKATSGEKSYYDIMIPSKK